MVNTERYYRPDEVAELLNVDRSTVYRMIKDIDNPLPALRLCGRGLYRIHGKDLEVWMEKNMVTPEDV